MTGIELIAEERQRQIDKENWSAGHDDYHEDFQLAQAALCYEQEPYQRDLPGGDIDLKTAMPNNWPWEDQWWKPTPDDRVRELTKAGGLYRAEQQRIERRIEKIAAEINRLNGKA